MSRSYRSKPDPDLEFKAAPRPLQAEHDELSRATLPSGDVPPIDPRAHRRSPPRGDPQSPHRRRCNRYHRRRLDCGVGGTGGAGRRPTWYRVLGGRLGVDRRATTEPRSAVTVAVDTAPDDRRTVAARSPRRCRGSRCRVCRCVRAQHLRLRRRACCRGFGRHRRCGSEGRGLLVVVISRCRDTRA
jgi:hypothetical protein